MTHIAEFESLMRLLKQLESLHAWASGIEWEKMDSAFKM